MLKSVMVDFSVVVVELFREDERHINGDRVAGRMCRSRKDCKSFWGEPTIVGYTFLPTLTLQYLFFRKKFKFRHLLVLN